VLDDAVWEVKFHLSHPTHLFTCSNDGSLRHWDSSDVASFNAPTGLLTASASRPGDRAWLSLVGDVLDGFAIMWSF